MDIWIIATFSAAIFQTLRFMLQKVLSLGALSPMGSTFARFFYAAPVAALFLAGYLWWSGAPLPGVGAGFWGFAMAGGVAQIIATACVVALFGSRNFAVGITFKKTEVIQTALVAMPLLGEYLSVAGWWAVVIGLAGVLMLSRTPDLRPGGLLRGMANRSAGLGLLSGLFFAICAVCFRAASLQIDSADALMRAAVMLAFVALWQTLALGLWLAWRDRAELGRVLRAWRQAGWLGPASVAGSLSWFTAFTTQQVAYVQALGQVELIFSLAASVLFFKERITLRELAGIGLLSVSILLLLLLA